jgi:hypothetical protein
LIATSFAIDSNHLFIPLFFAIISLILIIFLQNKK